MEVTEKNMREIMERYDPDQRYALAIMQDMQRTFQYVPREGLTLLSGYLGCPVSGLYSMVTFYKALSLVPKGVHIIKCCDLIEGIARELGIGQG